MVETARRAWPGINQPGGIAKITKLHHSPLTHELSHVDVFYPVERRHEKKVDMQWVTVRSNFMENAVKHGASARGALGRCSRCGSLRRDCGECDWKFEEEQRRLALLPRPQISADPTLSNNNHRNNNNVNDDDEKKKKKKKSKNRRPHTKNKDNQKSQLESLSSRFAKNAASSDPSDFLSDSSSASSTTTRSARSQSSSSDDTAELLQPYKSQISSSPTSSLGDYLEDDESISTLGDYLDSSDSDYVDSHNPQIAVETDFIQPEGDPTALPSDLKSSYSKVSSLPFNCLFDFYSQTLQKLSQRTLPDCMLKFSTFVQKSRPPPSGPPHTSAHKISLEKENLSMFSSFQKRLLFEGKDLLRECLRRLSSKRELNKYKRTVDEERWREEKKIYGSLQLEILEMKYDELDERIEELLQDCKSHLCSFFPESGVDATQDQAATQGDFDDEFDDSNFDDNNNNDNTFDDDNMVLEPLPHESSAPLSAHPHASRKKDPNRILPFLNSTRSDECRLKRSRNSSTKNERKRRNGERGYEGDGDEAPGDGPQERQERSKRRKRRKSKSKATSTDAEGNSNAGRSDETLHAKRIKSKPQKSISERMGEFLSNNESANLDDFFAREEKRSEKRSETTSQTRDKTAARATMNPTVPSNPSTSTTAPTPTNPNWNKSRLPPNPDAKGRPRRAQSSSSSSLPASPKRTTSPSDLAQHIFDHPVSLQIQAPSTLVPSHIPVVVEYLEQNYPTRPTHVSRVLNMLESSTEVNATIIRMLKMLKDNKHLRLADLQDDKRLMVLNLLTVAAKLIPNLSAKCALPIVDLMYNDPSSAASSYSVREALSTIKIETISTLLLKHYDGQVPEDLFDTDAPLPPKPQAAGLANASRAKINTVYILLGSASKPSSGESCTMTWKLICLLVFGNAGVLSNKFFSNLTDISSNDDDLYINPLHFNALSSEMNWIVKLPPCSDDAAILKIFKRLIQIVSVCPDSIFSAPQFSKRAVKKWLRITPTPSPSFTSESLVPLEMSPLPRNNLTSALVHLLRNHFISIGPGKAKKKRCFNAFSTAIFPEPKIHTDMEMQMYAACLGGVEGVWKFEEVWENGIARNYEGTNYEVKARHFESRSKVFAAILSSKGLDEELKGKCRRMLAECAERSAKILTEAVERKISGADMFDDSRPNISGLSECVAVIVGQAMSAGVLSGGCGVEESCEAVSLFAGPLCSALVGVLKSGGVGISVVLRALKILVSSGIDQLRNAGGAPGSSNDENSNPNETSFDEFGGDLDFCDVNLDLVFAQNALAKVEALKDLRKILAVVINEVRPSALFSLNISENGKAISQEARFEATKRIDDLIAIYTCLLGLEPAGASSWRSDVKESILDSKDILAKYHDSGWTIDVERRFFVRLCGHKVEASEKIVKGGWVECLDCIVGCLVDYSGLEAYESVDIGDDELRNKLKGHISAARSWVGEDLDGDSAGVKFGKGGVFGCIWTWIYNFADIMKGEEGEGESLGSVLEDILEDVRGEGGGPPGCLEREIWKRKLMLNGICEFCIQSQGERGRLTVVSSCVHGLIGGMKQFVLGEAMMGGRVIERIGILKGKYVEMGVGILAKLGSEISGGGGSGSGSGGVLNGLGVRIRDFLTSSLNLGLSPPNKVNYTRHELSSDDSKLHELTCADADIHASLLLCLESLVIMCARSKYDRMDGTLQLFNALMKGEEPLMARFFRGVGRGERGSDVEGLRKWVVDTYVLKRLGGGKGLGGLRVLRGLLGNCAVWDEGRRLKVWEGVVEVVREGGEGRALALECASKMIVEVGVDRLGSGWAEMRRICKGIIGSEGAGVDVVEGGLEVEDVDDEVEGAAKTFIAVLGRVLKE
ncbi:hypothetical protein TrVE_jg2295 [Triparma verrucosa]|uniref:Uncharacterized protein n=1 Tax=Triparma verrucosa TaxID=1606542 RepID=A0A9W7KW83_9STRA|nr:hypothetical protein TrVE_jg2295 [Triparma verrucosa]